MRYRYWIGIGASIILGLIFVAAGLGKLLHRAEAFWLFSYPLPAFLTPTLFCYSGNFLTTRPWFLGTGKIANGSIE